QDPTNAGDDGGRDRHTWRAREQAYDQNKQPGSDCPHGPGEVVRDPVMHSRNLTCNDQPPADEYQKYSEKEIGSILPHGSTLLVKIGSLILYDKRTLKLPLKVARNFDWVLSKIVQNAIERREPVPLILPDHLNPAIAT